MKIIQKYLLFLLTVFYIIMIPISVGALSAPNGDYKDTNETIREKQKAEQEKIKAEQEKLKTQKDKVKEKNLTEAKKKAVKEIDKAIQKLTKTKERVANMPTIAADLKVQLNTKIDEWTVKLSARKTAVNAATNKEELKSAMEGFKAEVKEAKRIIKDIVEAIHKTHLQKIIQRVESLIPKVEARATAITDALKKAEAIDLITDAKTQIANAKSFVDAGKIEEARKAVKTAHRDLKNALEIVNENGGEDE